MPRSWLGWTNRILWGFLILALPITSFPLVQRFLGGSSVAPLSVVPLILLSFTLLIPTIIRDKALPKESLPLLFFLGVSIIATYVGFYKYIPSFRETPILRNTFEGFLTLITGVAFFLAPIYMVKTEDDLRRTLILIYIASGVILLFCAAQAVSWLIFKEYPPILQQIQSWVSSSGRLFNRRVNGLAFEPSWLAHQLNIFYIPLFLSASYYGFTLGKGKLFKRVSLENVLLILSIVALFMSFSRIGWLTGLLLLAYLLFRGVNQLIDRTNYSSNPYSLCKRLIIWLGLLVVLIGLLFSLGLILTKIDPRMVKLFDLERFRQFGFMGWASQLGVAERVVFWMAAYQVYLLHPLLGIGLGGAGYFFPEVMPNFGFRLPEIIRVIISDTFIPNAKNLWIRLLSETGIIGFIFFVSWLYMIFKAALRLERSSEPEINRFIGMFGKLALLALLVEGFSTDTFGLPYYWLVFGIVVAVARFKRDGDQSSQVEE